LIRVRELVAKLEAIEHHPAVVAVFPEDSELRAVTRQVAADGRAVHGITSFEDWRRTGLNEMFRNFNAAYLPLVDYQLRPVLDAGADLELPQLWAQVASDVKLLGYLMVMEDLARSKTDPVTVKMMTHLRCFVATLLLRRYEDVVHKSGIPADEATDMDELCYLVLTSPLTALDFAFFRDFQRSLSLV
jgi:hypothetical protein